MNGVVKQISYQDAIKFLLPRHYSGRAPTISKVFGWYDATAFTPQHLKAVCTFGKPSNPWLCKGICGDKYEKDVYELNRLCRTEDFNGYLSEFVGACLRILKNDNWIVVSYSDMGMNHHGYVYQACNFIYTGCTKARTDKMTKNGRHSRHYNKNEKTEFV